jgi:hypothetical protein
MFIYALIASYSGFKIICSAKKSLLGYGILKVSEHEIEIKGHDKKDAC